MDGSLVCPAIDDDHAAPERWLQRTSDIRSALSSLTHPSSLIRVLDGAGLQWAVKVLGLDWRSRLLFWRPNDAERAAPHSDLAIARLGTEMLEFTAVAHDGAWMQFQSGVPTMVHFDDGSVLAVSPFPARLRHEPAPRPIGVSGNDSTS